MNDGATRRVAIAFQGGGSHNGRHGGAVLPDALRFIWKDYPSLPAKGTFPNATKDGRPTVCRAMLRNDGEAHNEQRGYLHKSSRSSRHSRLFISLFQESCGCPKLNMRAISRPVAFR